MNRAERRREARGGRTHKWSAHPSPKGLKKGNGWFGELDTVFRREDGQVVCMTRDLTTDFGLVTHLTITAHKKPSWLEKQEIKNELFGKESVGIEVFPKESELVNQSSMYHLWILHEVELPFGID